MATKKTSVAIKKTTKKTSAYSLKKHGETMLKLSKQPPSALLRLAVKDVKKVEKMKGVELDMGVFFTRKTSLRPCAVCMAGSVLLCDVKMPKTFKSADDDCVDFPSFDGLSKAEQYSKANGSVLEAIDAMRQANVSYALDLLDVPSNEFQNRAVDLANEIINQSFGEGPTQSMATYESYEAAAKVLEAVGL